MGEVVKFPKAVEYINNVPTPMPKTGEEYIKLCKKIFSFLNQLKFTQLIFCLIESSLNFM